MNQVNISKTYANDNPSHIYQKLGELLAMHLDLSLFGVSSRGFLCVQCRLRTNLALIAKITIYVYQEDFANKKLHIITTQGLIFPYPGL